MKIISDIKDIRIEIEQIKRKSKLIGFVPTMGALHEGHLSLIRRSGDETDYTVVSVFVNPTQFGEGEDFNKYPRDLEKDKVLLERLGVDLLFYPESKEVYPEGFDTWVVPGEYAKILEGEKRPGHFRGVCTVVLKLFVIVTPDVAFFGQKDAQQFVVLNRMVKDFNLSIRMVECPIVRDSDGLALSSRNAYLNSNERKAATVFYDAVKRAGKAIEQGERNRKEIIEIMEETVRMEPLAELDYADVVDAGNFRKIDSLEGTIYIVIAGYIGTTRLIDNVKMDVT